MFTIKRVDAAPSVKKFSELCTGNFFATCDRAQHLCFKVSTTQFFDFEYCCLSDISDCDLVEIIEVDANITWGLKKPIEDQF